MDRKLMAIHRQMIAKEQVDSQALIQRNVEAVLHHQVVAIVVIELRHLNGVAVQMVLGHFATLVDCVSFCLSTFLGQADGSYRLCEIDTQSRCEQGANWQFKPTTKGPWITKYLDFWLRLTTNSKLYLELRSV